MGYTGSDLDDYYSYQLVDKVNEQMISDDIGDVIRLGEMLEKALHIYTEKYSSIPAVAEMLRRIQNPTSEKRDA